MTHSGKSAHPAVLYLLSDSVGETAEVVTKAACSQFDAGHVELRRMPYLASVYQVEEALQEAAATANAAVIYTLVSPNLRKALKIKAAKLNLTCVDVMGPVVDALTQISGLDPRNEPGSLRKIDEAYFNRIEAIEFAVKFDDGKEPRGLLRADIVVTGVSRTSKTPLCMYLAHKGLKAANLPLVPEVTVPQELFQVPANKAVGLTIKADHLYEIRRERLRTMGLAQTAEYANYDRILEEIEYAIRIMRKIGCPIIDVTNKATEETAAKVLEYYRKGAELR